MHVGGEMRQLSREQEADECARPQHGGRSEVVDEVDGDEGGEHGEVAGADGQDRAEEGGVGGEGWRGARGGHQDGDAGREEGEGHVLVQGGGRPRPHGPLQVCWMHWHVAAGGGQLVGPERMHAHHHDADQRAHQRRLGAEWSAADGAAAAMTPGARSTVGRRHHRHPRGAVNRHAERELPQAAAPVGRVGEVRRARHAGHPRDPRAAVQHACLQREVRQQVDARRPGADATHRRRRRHVADASRQHQHRKCIDVGGVDEREFVGLQPEVDDGEIGVARRVHRLPRTAPRDVRRRDVAGRRARWGALGPAVT